MPTTDFFDPALKVSFDGDEEDDDFVLFGLAAGDLGVLVGDGGVGKSMFSLQMSASVALGENLTGAYDWQPQQNGRVLYVSGVDTADIVGQRFRDLLEKLNQNQVKILDQNLDICAFDANLALMKKRDKFSYPYESNLYFGLKEKLKGYRLCVLDPISSFHKGLSEDNYGEMRKLMQSLKKITTETGCAILVTTFPPDFESDVVCGHDAIIDSARFVLSMHEHKNDFVLLDNHKSNYTKHFGKQLLERDLNGLLQATTWQMASMKPGSAHK